MRSMLTSRRALVVIVGVVFALSWVLPAIGASPTSLIHRALATATKALKKANSAQSSANGAQNSAKGAQSSADSAGQAAKNAQATADKALAKAESIPVGARAYARMDNPCATSSACSIDHAKGISGIRQTSTGGLYCVTAPGLDPTTTAWTVSVDAGDTGAAVGEAQAMPNSNGAACNTGEFEVQTTRGGGGNSTTVAFFIVIP
jgi:hypothetical protein